MTLDPKVWGPHYWFVLHTIAISYPLNPNDVTKKKYYDFIQNLPLFLPIEDIGNSFSKFIDKYPVTPYLDSRESFIKWMHFIHNKINVALKIPEMTMDEAMVAYYKNYKPVAVKNLEEQKRREKIIFLSILIAMIIVCAALYYTNT
jgi:fumarate reductase subunit C